DAIYSAAQLLRDRDRIRRKIILTITDGLNGKEFNRHTYEETLSTLLDANISVYGVAVGSTSYQRRLSRLLDYATKSGGDIRYGAKSGSLEKLYSQIAEQARHEYTLAYMPPGNKVASNYHSLEGRTTR